MEGLAVASKYSVGEKLHHGALVSVYRGVRLDDGLPIVLKRLERPRPNSSDVPRFRREFALARTLAAAGVVEVLDLDEGRDGLTLVMRDRGGASLDRILEAGRPTVAESLRIAAAAAAALGTVHARNVIHKDVSPANIIWNRQSGTVELIDFGIAAELAREAASAAQAFEGTLPYIAPEQTGRMNRSVDWRADFYALGATLYELLTGHVPFEGEDTLAVVHGHIARAPVPPCQLDPSVPALVSDIVLKLLAKDPEARYQSGHGLKADLEACIEALEAGRPVPAFALGRQDRSERFRIPERLYGREEEARLLLAAYERVCGGRAELLLVGGSPGIGKSALVHEVHKPMTAKRGHFVEGKFDQVKRAIPYSALIQAFDQLARRLLAEPEAELAERRAVLAQAVGSTGAVVTELIPSLALILGEQPPVPPLGPVESEFRFQMTFQNLVMALATPERPLVVFLDDLQWADRPSLDLLAKLAGCTDLRHMLLIGAFRDAEVPPGHAFHKMVEAVRDSGTHVESLAVGPLDETAVRRLVADTLRREEREVAALAEVCRAKTEGNPFFLAQFLLSLVEAGLVRFDPAAGAWGWDQAAVAGHASTANVVELMVAKMQRLPAETQRVLSLAACVGNSFDLGTLAVAADRPVPDLAGALWPGLREEMVLPVGDAYRYASDGTRAMSEDEASALLTSRYRFLHDRVQQAAYALIPEAERAATHLSIGRLLLARGAGGGEAGERSERLFDVIAHVNQGVALVTDAEERHRMARLNLEAAKQANASAAFEPAALYAEAGLAFMGDEGWAADYPLMLELSLAAVGAACMGSDYAKADALAEALVSKVRDPADAVPARFFQVSAATVRGDLRQALDLGLGAVRALGVHLPRRGSALSILSALARGGWAMLRHSRRPARPATDPAELARVQMAIRLLSVLQTAAFVARRDLMVPIAMRNIRIALGSGVPTFTAGAHVTWAAIAASAGLRRSAYRSAKRTMDLAEAGTRSIRAGQAMYVSNYYGLHWVKPLSEIRPAMLEAHQLALNGGESDDAGYTLVTWLRIGWHMGTELSRLEAESHDVLRRLTRIGFQFYTPLVAGLSQAIENLRQGTATPWRLTGRYLDEEKTLADLKAANNSFAVAGFLLVKMQIARMFGAATEARAIRKEFAGYTQAQRGNYLQAVALFESGLVEAMGPFSTQAERRRAGRALNRTIRWFRKSTAVGPANHRHRLLLLEAEQLRLLNKPEAAALRYAAAIAAAGESGFTHELAAANERAADFYAERGMGALSLFHRTQARDVYRRWEAWAKVAEMERRFPELAAQGHGTQRGATRRSSSTDRLNTGALDIEAVLKAAQAISGEIHREALVDRLLRTVFEVAGAERGSLLLCRSDGHLVLAAEGDESADVYRALPALDPDSPADDGGPRLPATVVAYTARVLEPVVLADAVADPRFAEDPYIRARRPKSVLTLPLARQGQLVGLLYLENNLVTNAFVDQRLEAPRLLAAQIAISLENARLYDELAAFNRNLEGQVADRTRALSEQSEVLRRTLDEVSAAHARLQETQQQLVQAEKMAALGQLVAGVAHEINTPLGVALTAASFLSDETQRIAKGIEAGKLRRAEFDAYATTAVDSTTLLLANLSRAADLVQGFKQVAADQTSDERRVFTLDDWIGDLVLSLRPMWQKPGHKLTVDCPEHIQLDNYPGALAQILTNLISNTLVHGFEAGHVGQLGIAVTEPDADSVEIVYTDDGRGIAPDSLPAIFDPFFTTRRAQGSTGLGLHIVYNLVAQRLGGTIKVTSELGAGVRFTLRFPRVAPV
ncbi:trifunctional serine/threonine-protein kinase/ATP-binding protein/sensor histidine kinase [Azospirillum rugosum]|uniref:histidine kinase n=1 Tax=Azospirillum rugosum TaxID=416170 RepID=A0ABS4SSA8_9PROT|nr:ATP-binding sensor histidine kinase [Azospirillum rugosum]MBP2295442.1 putative ATPase/signal transduction histidine kinase [Azospirillum rugosum]MDQ0528321.1 putative ATPase/signal transduction histidine kinase [Azospirillum rugosum]